MRGLPLLLRGYVWLASAFLLFPVAIVVISAFTGGDFVTFPPAGLSLRWFANVLSDPGFMWPLWNSLKLGLATTLTVAVLGVPAAIALVRSRSPAARMLELFMLSPLSLPSILLAVGLLFVAGHAGLGASFAALLAGHVVIATPYLLRTVMATYAGIDASLEEAAVVLGASPLQCLRHVTVPLMKSGVFAGAVFAFLISFDEVAVSLLLTNTRTMTLPVSILSYLVYNYDPSVAAIATVQIGVAVVLLLVLDRMVGVRQLMQPARA